MPDKNQAIDEFKKIVYAKADSLRNLVNGDEVEPWLKTIAHEKLGTGQRDENGNQVLSAREQKAKDWLLKVGQNYQKKAGLTTPWEVAPSDDLSRYPAWLIKASQEGKLLSKLSLDPQERGVFEVILDYLKAENGPELDKDWSNIGVDHALKAEKEWREKLHEIERLTRSKKEVQAGTEIFIKEGQLDDTAFGEMKKGWSWVKLSNKSALDHEGTEMRHCVGSYASEVQEGNVEIYSLRGPGNRAKLTIELRGSKILQLKAVENKACPPELMGQVGAFIKKIESKLEEENKGPLKFGSDVRSAGFSLTQELGLTHPRLAWSAHQEKAFTELLESYDPETPPGVESDLKLKDLIKLAAQSGKTNYLKESLSFYLIESRSLPREDRESVLTNAFIDASKYGHLDAVEVLWNAEGLNKKDSFGRALEAAAGNGEQKIVENLLMVYQDFLNQEVKESPYDSKINKQNHLDRLRNGASGALAEAVKGSHENVVDVLLDAGADPKANGSKSIVESASTGNLGLFRKLWPLSDFRSYFVYEKVLEEAAKNGRAEIVKEVLQEIKKAPVNHWGQDWEVHFEASKQRAFSSAAEAGSKKSLEYLIQDSAVPKHVLHVGMANGVKKGHQKVVDFLSPMLSEVVNQNTLKSAVEAGHTNIVKSLLQKVDPEWVKNSDLLVLSVEKRHEDLVDLLWDRVSDEQKINALINAPRDDIEYVIKKAGIELKRSAIEPVIKNSRFDVLERLAKDVDISSKHALALEFAIKSRKPQIISSMLMELKQGLDYSGALTAAIQNDLNEIKEKLMGYVDFKKYGSEILESAVSYRKLEAIKEILPRVLPLPSDSKLLELSVYKEDLELVKLLLPHCDPKLRDSAALTFAVRQNNGPMVELLLPLSKPINETINIIEDAIDGENTKDGGRGHPKGHPDLVKKLLDSGPMDAHKLNGLLKGAVYSRNQEILNILLEKGADPKANESLALRAAAKTGQLDMVKLLMPLSEINAKSKSYESAYRGDGLSEGSSALSVALETGRENIINELLPWTSDSIKQEVLARAVKSENLKDVKAILEHMTKIDNSGQLITEVSGNYSRIDPSVQEQIIEALKPKLTKAADYGEALLNAVAHNHQKVVQLLWPLVQEVESQQKALIEAVKYKHHDLVDFFIEKGANPKFDESKAFIVAASAGDLDMVKKLLPLSDPNAKQGLALTEAATYGHENVVKFLHPLVDIHANESAALIGASRKGYEKIVDFLLPTSDPKFNKSEALRVAASNGHLEVVKKLLPLSDVKAHHSEALINAVVWAKSVEMVKILLPFSDITQGKSGVVQQAKKANNPEILAVLENHIRAEAAKNPSMMHQALASSAEVGHKISVLKSKISSSLHALQDLGLQGVKSLESKIGSKLHVGVSGIGGLLAGIGAAAAGLEAKKEFKDGKWGSALLSTVESAGQATVAGTMFASVIGVAKAAPLAKVVGPLGAVLGYFGAARSALEAYGASESGQQEKADAEVQKAVIRAAGATGSVAATMATGAAIGSVVPGLGSAIGLVVGAGVAMIAEHYASKVDEKIQALDNMDIKDRLALRRRNGEEKIKIADVKQIMIAEHYASKVDEKIQALDNMDVKKFLTLRRRNGEEKIKIADFKQM